MSWGRNNAVIYASKLKCKRLARKWQKLFCRARTFSTGPVGGEGGVFVIVRKFLEIQEKRLAKGQRSR